MDEDRICKRFWTSFIMFWLLIVMVGASVTGSMDNLFEEHTKEFSCGMLYYRTFYLDDKRDVLYVGAMDKIFRLNLNNISDSNCENDVLSLGPSSNEMCILKGKSANFDCRNHIRIIQPIGDGDRLYICGTNAFLPKDLMINSNLTHLPESEYLPGVGESAIGKCPHDPLDISTAIWVEKGNPKELPALYSGLNYDFSRNIPLIFRSNLYNLKTGKKIFDFMTTIADNSKWLSKSDFIGSFDIGEYVFFFFREIETDYVNNEKMMFSRVARICKNDIGGKNYLRNNWVTYLKARLTCFTSGEFPFYFDEIQSIYKTPGDDTHFYGTFTTSSNVIVDSAICSFNIEKIQNAFLGEFKNHAANSKIRQPVPSENVPEPRPGQCIKNTMTLSTNVLNFIRSHPLMDSVVLHEYENPVFYQKDDMLIRLVVDKFNIDYSRISFEYTIYYAGSSNGRVYKIVHWVDNNGISQSNLLDIFDVTPGERIQTMEISKKHKSIYIASDKRIKQIDLVICSRRYGTCQQCVLDPYCGWDKEDNTCKPYVSGLLQDVTQTKEDVCKSSIIQQNLQVTLGQSVHLCCFTKLPEVFKHEAAKWVFHSKLNNKKHQITYKYVWNEKFIESSEKGLVILNVSKQDEGRYNFWLGNELFCSYKINIDFNRRSSSDEPKDNEYLTTNTID